MTKFITLLVLFLSSPGLLFSWEKCNPNFHSFKNPLRLSIGTSRKGCPSFGALFMGMDAMARKDSLGRKEMDLALARDCKELVVSAFEARVNRYCENEMLIQFFKKYEDDIREVCERRFFHSYELN